MKTSSYRIPVEIKADIILDDINYKVLIVNLSADGACIENDFVINKIHLTEGTVLRLEFLNPKDAIVSVESKVVWSRNFEPDDERYNVGLRFTDISPEYQDFFHNLYIRDMRVM